MASVHAGSWVSRGVRILNHLGQRSAQLQSHQAMGGAVSNAGTAVVPARLLLAFECIPTSVSTWGIRALKRRSANRRPFASSECSLEQVTLHLQAFVSSLSLSLSLFFKSVVSFLFFLFYR